MLSVPSEIIIKKPYQNNLVIILILNNKMYVKKCSIYFHRKLINFTANIFHTQNFIFILVVYLMKRTIKMSKNEKKFMTK